MHNSKSFDSYIGLSAMIKLDLKPMIIVQGNKFICIHEQDYGHKYKDSLFFLSMPLASMP